MRIVCNEDCSDQQRDIPVPTSELFDFPTRTYQHHGMSSPFGQPKSKLDVSRAFFSFLNANAEGTPSSCKNLPELNGASFTGSNALKMSSLGEIEETVRQLVRVGLDRLNGKKSAIFLSGGLDSSILFRVLRDFGEQPLVVLFDDSPSLESILAREQLASYSGEILELKKQPLDLMALKSSAKTLQIPIFNLRAVQKVQLLNAVKSFCSETVFFSGFGADEAFLYDEHSFDRAVQGFRDEIDFLAQFPIEEAKLAQTSAIESPSSELYRNLVWRKLSLRLEKQIWEEAGFQLELPFLDPVFQSAVFNEKPQRKFEKRVLREAFAKSLGDRVAFQKKVPVAAVSPLSSADSIEWLAAWKEARLVDRLLSVDVKTAQRIQHSIDELELSSELRNRLVLRFLSFSFAFS